MSAVGKAICTIKSAFFADGYNLCIDTDLICESFYHNDFVFIRTPTKHFKRPHNIKTYRQISKSEYEFSLSAYRTKINQSQAKGLTKYIQLELPL